MKKVEGAWIIEKRLDLTCPYCGFIFTGDEDKAFDDEDAFKKTIKCPECEKKFTANVNVWDDT